MNARDLIRGADAVLLDVDGVVCLGDRPIDGAREGLAWVRDAASRVLLVTNSSGRSREQHRARVEAAGGARDELITAADAVVAELHRRGHSRALVVGTPELRGELARGGISTDSRDATAVVSGYPPFFDDDALRAAADAIGELEWFATNRDMVVPSPDGPLPDAGEVIRRLSAMTGREPVVCGKPCAPISRLVAGVLNGARTVVVIGDNPATDVAWARANRWRAVLVGDDAGDVADACIPSLGALAEPS